MMILRLTLSISFLCVHLLAGEQLKLWYTHPASAWEEALPLGNGKTGAMVFGQPFKLRRAYPLMKGAAQFMLHWLVKDPATGSLVTIPSSSPENNELDAAKQALYPFHIGQHGQLQEWFKDWDDANDKHRHISQLFGLYPGSQIRPDSTPELDAAMAPMTPLNIAKRYTIEFATVKGHTYPIVPLTRVGQGGAAPAAATHGKFYEEAVKTLRKQVLEKAAWAMQQRPITVTANSSPRSAGGKHDFFSEADYWWPNPMSTSVDSPYIQKDGMSNPENFVEHRKAVIRLSRIIGALASAYKLTGDDKYVKQALVHCKAWFVDTATLMNPSLLYSQAIKGRVTGRGTGIIDAIQLMEVTQGLLVMEKAKSMDKPILETVRGWFRQYLEWVTTHPYGMDEMNATNNHGTCWVMQVAAFATFTQDRQRMDFCRERYKHVLLPNQIAADGSFPQELRRTKPYGYSIFNLDAMTTICQILSTPEDNLWTYRAPNGRSIEDGIAFLYPFVADKTKWPHPPDVMYWKEWPVAQPFLIFGANADGEKGNANNEKENARKDWFEAWRRLDHNPETEEVIRNLPIRNPLIWIN